MITKDLLPTAYSCVDLGNSPEGPDTKDQALMMAQAATSIVIAEQLTRIADALETLASCVEMDHGMGP
jgi:hypothetical protein